MTPLSGCGGPHLRGYRQPVREYRFRHRRSEYRRSFHFHTHAIPLMGIRVNIIGRIEREPQTHPRPAPSRIVEQLDPSPVLLEDLRDDWQTESGTAIASRHIR